jgi:hypothetical protein
MLTSFRPTPASAPAHTAPRSHAPGAPPIASRQNGVYDPAIRMKIIE